MEEKIDEFDEEEPSLFWSGQPSQNWWNGSLCDDFDY